ncbi:hypothetical protein QJ527_03530 [Enterococcus mundtii]|uniref:hypothetical protein n=1 Tax=Enterococcus TaxID=1350 RepID=UPI00044873AB|nr:hypothetical protein [Enterococcus mundtii]AZP93142.1 hypothetical protein CYK55_08585 [Enterococcus mundtii]EYT96539.1 hypothetical protein AK89_03335 [Enterococcus mundtii CRL35]MDA9428688.1 hypothetical protein [Enterococcus mundtii 1A]MDK4210617.1 hypothetical protein [Enterococcus mundtii]MDO7878127.1 hypothetical protein [Enterococcus mundtii]
MKVKNILATGLMFGTILATGASVQADIIINGADQTIDNSIGGSIDTTADVEINGTLGFDNTDPEAPEPGNPDKWLNVTLPLKAVFFTEPEDYKTILGGEHKITNHSGRPVKISLGSYTVSSGDISAIDQLTLVVSLGSNNLLIENGAVNSNLSGDLMTLASPNARPSDLQGDSAATFTFKGEVDTDILDFPTDKGAISIASTLTLNIEALDEAGDPYP